MSDKATATPVATITLKVPDSKAPGYLRRMLVMAELQDELKAGISAPLLRKMVEALAQFVTVPEGVEVRAALLELSEDDFKAIFAAMTGSADPLAETGAPS